MPIKGAKKLIANLKRRQQKFSKEITIAAGYDAPYAIFVHEAIEMKLKGKKRPSGIGVYWGPSGKAKFLEDPARQETKAIGAAISTTLQAGGSIVEALMAGGNLLLDISEKQVPVETGKLVESTFIKRIK